MKRALCWAFGHYRPFEHLIDAWIDDALNVHWSTCWPCLRCGFGTPTPGEPAPRKVLS